MNEEFEANGGTILEGDCSVVLQDIPDDYVDLTLTSPPYDAMRQYKGFSFDCEGIAKQLFRVTRKGGVVVWVVGDETVKGDETGSSFKQALCFKETGFKLFDTMIYQKQCQGAVGNNRGYWQVFEYMFVFSKDKPATINLIHDRANKESRGGDRGTKRNRDGSLRAEKRPGYGEYGRRTNIWCYGTGKGKSATDEFGPQHPAIFPEQLAEDHIISWSNPGNTVLDPMCGSGTTCKMAKLNNRKYIGIEISPEYAAIARSRLTETVCRSENETETAIFEEE